jgi:hypothetical protein
MSQIFRIMVRCPTTGNLLDTGITTSGRESLNNDLFEEGKVSCRYCRQSHDFQQHAFLSAQQDSFPNGPWRPNP